ncbi:dihydroorotase [bacterium]|nr:MAG: dihydroorotase [bacterium]
MRYDLIIRGGTLVTHRETYRADVAVLGDRIAKIGDLSSDEGTQEIDAEHLLVFPGLIDSQVHFREPGLTHKEDIETGTKSALLGGVTTVLEMPNTDPTTTTPKALADKVERAQGRAWCDIGFFFGATTDNAHTLSEAENLPGTPGIKMFVGSSTGSLLVGEDEGIRLVLQNGKKRVAIHSEDEARNAARKIEFAEKAAGNVRWHPTIRDAESARLATERVIRLSEETGRAVHILHISTRDELPVLADAKGRGLRVTCEVTPQHLWFCAPEDYDRLGSRIQQNPPVRSKEHRDALWFALETGLFDVFGSDHAPHTIEEKGKPYPGSPSGMPGVQTMLPVLMTYVAQGRLPVTEVARMACRNPARLYDMNDRGKVAEGFLADLTLVDARASRVVTPDILASRCGWSPWENETLTGWPVAVIKSGVLAAADGETIGTPVGGIPIFS